MTDREFKHLVEWVQRRSVPPMPPIHEGINISVVVVDDHEGPPLLEYLGEYPRRAGQTQVSFFVNPAAVRCKATRVVCSHEDYADLSGRLRVYEKVAEIYGPVDGP